MEQLKAFMTVADVKKILKDQPDESFVVFGVDDGEDVKTYSIQGVGISDQFITFWSMEE